MNFKEFKTIYLKKPVVEYPNNRKGKAPLATVKVITYNHVNYIKQCLDSILMQKTDFDFEILIAEDDSNDGTREVCIEYAKKFPDKIKLLLNSRANNIPINGKPSGTFNSVYANFCIKSKYIANIEGDDYWVDENSLQKRVVFLEKNEDHVMCFHNSKIYYEDTKKFEVNLKSPLKTSTSIKGISILKTVTPTLTILYRNFLVELFDEKMLEVISGDTILKGKLMHYGKAKYLHDIKPAVYRVHNGGIFSKKSYNYKKFARLKNKIYILEHYKKNKWQINYLHEHLFQTYFILFINDILVRKKINFKNFKKAIASFTKSSNKKYCIDNLAQDIKTSLRK